MTIHGSILVGALLAVAACVEPDHASRASVRDSAGITIVESPPPDSTTPEWFLSAEPVVVLGELDGPVEEQFGPLVSARRLSSGEIAVADADSHQLRLFDSTGAWLRSVGQRGEGPGDFSLLVGLLAGDDDVITTWDIRLRRLTKFSPAGDVIDLFQVGAPELVVNDQGHAFVPGASPVSRFDDGSYLARGVMAQFVRTEHSRLYPDSLTVWIVDQTGAIRLVQRLFLGESYEHYFGGRSFSFGDRPYGRRGSLAPAGAGWFYTDGGEFEIRGYDRDAHLRTMFRARRERRLITANDRARYRDEQVAVETDDAMRRNVAAALDWVEWPGRMPAYDALVADPAGNLWAKVFPDTAATTDWDIYDPTGRLIAVAAVPSDLLVIQVDEDWVLGMRKGEMDEPLFVLYRIGRTR